MPIVGVSDEKALHYGDGTPLLGRIYKGDEKQTKQRKDGSEYQIWGKDRETFRVEFEPQFEFLRPQWDAFYCPNGEDGPKNFGWVELCGNDIEVTFPSYMEEYKANQKLIRRCTGDVQVKWWSEEAKDHLTGQKVCEMKAGEGHSCECQMTGRLDIILIEFNNYTGVHGHFLVTTHSYNDIRELTGFLRHLKKRGLESFESVPFTFGREYRPIPVSITDREGRKTGEQIVKEFSLLYLYLEPEFFKAAFVPEWKAKREALLAGYNPQLAANSSEPGSSRKVLGSGEGPRIMGRDEPAPPAPDVDIVEGEVTDTPTTYSLPDLHSMVRPLFGDDLAMQTTIAELIAGESKTVNIKHVIKADYNTTFAATCVLMHRAKQVGMDEVRVKRLIEESEPTCKSVRDYLNAGHTVKDVWGLVQQALGPAEMAG